MSEIRVDSIVSQSGTGNVAFNKGVTITGVVTSTEQVVGSGVTINASGIDAVSGVITATTFKGDLTGDVTGNVSGSSGSPTGTAGGLENKSTGSLSSGTVAPLTRSPQSLLFNSSCIASKSSLSPICLYKFWIKSSLDLTPSVTTLLLLPLPDGA